jgi:hypothetical protein
VPKAIRFDRNGHAEVLALVDVESMNAQDGNRSVPGEKDRVVLVARASLAVGILMGRWTLKILAELSEGGRRYHDLHDALGGISHKVLTDTRFPMLRPA